MLRLVRFAAAAEAVIVAIIYAGRRGKQLANRLLVKLPKVSAKRKMPRKIFQELCAKRGDAFCRTKRT
jgi:hypothetical protein